MKISHEERRTVARRIRLLDQRGKNGLFSTCFNCGKWLGVVYGDKDYCAEKLRLFSDCLDIQNALADKIAELIDRPTTTLTEDEDGRTCCANCGCVALYMSDAAYCPDCGAEVVE